MLPDFACGGEKVWLRLLELLMETESTSIVSGGAFDSLSYSLVRTETFVKIICFSLTLHIYIQEREHKQPNRPIFKNKTFCKDFPGVYTSIPQGSKSILQYVAMDFCAWRFEGIELYIKILTNII